MNFIDKMINRFIKMNKRLKRWQRAVSILSAVVVFITTYTLVLPAITLDKETASTQAGMEIAASENEPSSDGTVYEAETEEEPEAETAEEPQEEDPAVETQEEDASEASQAKMTAEEQQEEAAAEDGSSDSGSQGAEALEDQPADSNADISTSNEDAASADTENEVSQEEEPAPATVENEEAPVAGETSETAEPIEEIKLITEETQLVYKGEDYVVYADFDASAKLPEGVELRVKEITKESDPETYDAYYEKALSEMQDKYDENTELSFARFYDIAFIVDNKEVEPSSDVKIRIEYDDAVDIEKDTTVDTIHFDKEDEEKVDVINTEIDSEKKGSDEAVKAVEFESDRFSVYGVVGSGTITTRVITADGETYTISVKYGQDAEIPSGAVLEAAEIDFDSEAYDNYIKLTQEELDKEGELGVELARFFDVNILVDGQKIEPKAPVEVTITYEEPFEIIDPQDLKIVHFADNGTEIINVDNEQTEVTEITYKQDSFSVIGTISTTNSRGWPTSPDNTGYILLFKDGEKYYALNHDGTVRKVDYINNTVIFLGEGSNVKEYAYDYVWNLNTRGTQANVLNPVDPTRNLDIVYDLIPPGAEEEILFSDRQRNYNSRSINGDWYLYTNYRGQYTVTVSDGELHRVPLGDEKASPIYYVPYSTTIVTPSQSEYLTQVDIQALIDIWQHTMTQKLEVDKTAEVYDYDNRIYEVDLFASSGYYIVTPDLVLDFVVDASRSMYFPENLTKVGEYNKTSAGLRSWLNTTGDRDQVYFVIDDKNGAATNYAVFYQNGHWNAIDASLYDAPDGRTGTPVAEANWQDNLPSGVFKKDMDGNVYIANPKVAGEPWCRLDYMEIAVKAAAEILYTVNPGARIGLVSFNRNVSHSGPYTKDHMDDLIYALEHISLDGGTNHQIGLEQAYEDFTTWEHVKDCQTSVILITDGAPNAAGINWTTIGQAATNVKNLTNNFGQPTSLYTLGLSLEHVGDNAEELAHIATSEADAFNAESASEVVDCISRIISGLVTEANLQGNVTDVIDQAFYPVNPSTGMPVESGTWITLEGTVTQEGAEDAVGQITYDSSAEEWKVVWNDQRIDWSITDDQGRTEHGWHGQIFVKAKEDFLGGNTISTNDDGSKVEATKFLRKAIDEHGEIIYIPTDFPIDERDKERKFETPYVNVDELAFTQNSTEWTVYLGTEVDPLTEVKELWDLIKVQEVVTEDGQLIYQLIKGSTEDGRPQIEGLERNEFDLKDIVTLTESDWSDLLDKKTVSKQYDKYGHTKVGKIQITLNQEIVSGEEDLDPSPHNTAVVGSPVEKYTLTVKYIPELAKTTVNYHTGTQLTETPGATTGTITSENVHKINVFAKGFQITKTDEGFQKVISDAEFKLYRTARDTDDPSSLVTLDGLPGKYMPVATLEISDSGTAVVNPVERLKDNENYYLVETKAPEGYLRLKTPIPVTLTISDKYLPKPDGTETTTKPTDGIYDWTETAKLEFTIGTGIMRTDETGTEDLTHVAVTEDSENSIVYYKIANTSGFELPHTGGPGTGMFIGLGSILIVIAGVLLLRRRILL